MILRQPRMITLQRGCKYIEWLLSSGVCRCWSVYCLSLSLSLTRILAREGYTEACSTTQILCTVLCCGDNLALFCECSTVLISTTVLINSIL